MYLAHMQFWWWTPVATAMQESGVGLGTFGVPCTIHTDRSHHLECVLHAADASRIAWCGHAGALCCECLAALLGRQHLTRKVTQPPRHGLTAGGTQHTTNHSTSTVCQLGFALASPSCQPCTHPVALWFADPAGMLRVACQYTVHTTGAPRARACAGWPNHKGRHQRQGAEEQH